MENNQYIMLPSIYNRRNFQTNRPSLIANNEKSPLHQSSLIIQHIAKLSSSISSLSAALQDKLKEGQVSTHSNKYPQQQQERFKIIQIPLYTIKEGDDRRLQIKKFLADATSFIFSQAFHFFQQAKLTEKKYRLFCSHNLLYNLIKFGQLNKLSLDQLEQMDNHLKKNVLIFLKCKYPQSESTQSNLKLASMITDINNLNSNSNDYIARSKVIFEKKQSGDYSRQIMGFINNIINLAKIEVVPQKSLYKRFFQDMTEIFTNIESQEWVLLAKSGIFTTSSKETQNDESLQKKVREQKYREKVQQYTKYLIGKKLSDNISGYSQNEIKEQNLSVKSPALMRVLTKWCEQLQDIFNTNQSILQREQMFRMRDGTQRYLERGEKQILIQCLNDQKQVLKEFLAKLKENIYQNQLSIISHFTPQHIFRQFCSEFESCVGYVTSLFVNSNQNYLLSYLNKLIDCILQAEEEWVRRMRHGSHFRQEIPSLITFKIGDLFRCKCASKQSEVTAIFAYLKELSSRNPQFLEIIRVKNRLNQGTKDILINFKYLNIVTAQMQISVNEDKSNFIKCSDKANHFLYQLERASFGPFSQMANISANVDQRFSFYFKQFEKINEWSQDKIQQKEIPSTSCIHTLEQLILPIWCSQCKTFSSSFNLVTPHQKCTKCKMRICSKCLVAGGKAEHMQMSREITWMEFHRKLSSFPSKLGKVQVINLQKKAQNKILVVKKLEDKTIVFEYDEEEQKLVFDTQIKKDRETQEFRRMGNSRKLLNIFKIQKDQEKNVEKLLKVSLLKRSLELVGRNQKKTFVYDNREIGNTKVFQDFVLKSVQKVSLMSTKIQDLSIFPTVFPNCQRIVLNSNTLKRFDKFGDWVHLKQLHLQNNQLNSVPLEFCQLRELQILNLNDNHLEFFCDVLSSIKSLKSVKVEKNKIKEISSKVGNLQNLQILWLKSNKIKNVPDELGSLCSLKTLILQNNQLLVLPITINKLVNLQILNIADNKIAELNENIFCNMAKLRDFYGYQNSLIKIPSSIKLAYSLTKFSIFRNKVQLLPPQLKELKNLSIVNLMQNPLRDIQIGLDNINNQAIIDLNLSSIGLKQVSSKMLVEMGNIKNFSFYNNNISNLPREIGSLRKLQRLWIGLNSITLLPNQLCHLKDLKVLIINKNKLTGLPKKIGNLKRLQELDIEDNEINFLPKQLFSISSLVRLFAGGNNFKEVPAEIGQLRRLKQLGLFSNSLKLLPSTMENLKNLDLLEINEKILDDHSQPISNQILFSIYKKKKKI